MNVVYLLLVTYSRVPNSRGESLRKSIDRWHVLGDISIKQAHFSINCVSLFKSAQLIIGFPFRLRSRQTFDFDFTINKLLSLQNFFIIE